LSALDPTLSSASLQPIDLDRIEGGGHLLLGNIDPLSSMRGMLQEAAQQADASPAPALVPSAPADTGPSAIDRVQDGGVFLDFSAEAADEQGDGD
jgi:hypothetical protein